MESETELAYSGLHQLCAPLLDGHLDRLPVPQRDALATALGMTSAGAPPDRFLVGLATLSLVADAAEQQPVACFIDDGQWLDRASGQVLSFVARRLLAEPVALICATRTGQDDDVLAGLPELAVHGLTDQDARALLLSSIHGPMDSAIIDQIVTESHGNPLALLELPRTWQESDLAGGYGLPDTHTTTHKIERSYVRRLELLPTETRLLALAAAAEPLGDPVLLSRAASLLGADLAMAHPAVDAGLLEVGDRVSFAHPLARSATYHQATTDSRHRVHSALAAATDARGRPGPTGLAPGPRHRGPGRERRGGAGAIGRPGAGPRRARRRCRVPDPRHGADTGPCPAQPPRPGRRVRQRPGRLVPDRTPPARDRRPRSDRRESAREPGSSSEPSSSWRPAEAMTPPHRCWRPPRNLETFDVDLARETYLDAFTASLFGARLNVHGRRRDVAAAASAAPHGRGRRSRAVDLLLDAFTAITSDYERAVPVCRAAVDRLHRDRSSPSAELRWFWHGTVLALELWDDRGAYALSDHHTRVARSTGALSQLALALSSHTPVLVFRGTSRRGDTRSERPRPSKRPRPSRPLRTAP